MKKFKFIVPILSLVTVLSLTSCSGIVQTDSDESVEASAQETELGIYEVSDEASEFAVSDIKAFAVNGHYYLLMDFTYKNLTEESVTLSDDDIYLFTDNEASTEKSYNDFYNIGNDNDYLLYSWNPLDDLINVNQLYSGQSTVKSGRTERGLIIYEYTRPFSALEAQLFDLSIYIDPQDIDVVNIQMPTPTPEPGNINDESLETTDYLTMETAVITAETTAETVPETSEETTEPVETSTSEEAAE